MEPVADILISGLSEDEQAHLHNVVANLQLVADLGYGDAALFLEDATGQLTVAADVRPVTAVTAFPTTRVGQPVSSADEPEAYAAVDAAAVTSGADARVTRGITFSATAYPIGASRTLGALVRYVSQSVAEAPGGMERAFMSVAEDLVGHLQSRPLVEHDSGEPFVTSRRAGDGLLRVGADDVVEYASPNAINIMRAAGVTGSLDGIGARSLPGAAVVIVPVLRGGGCARAEITVAGRVLSYRSLALPHGGAVVLVEDITEARRSEQELKVKDATIREVHHRVKNNLQTVASLLRIQARRADTPAAGRALLEAVERIGAMAVVHEMLAAATDERVDLTDAARTVVDMVRQGVASPDSTIEVSVEGDPVIVPATAATSLALAVAELVHNAIEHGLGSGGDGRVAVMVRRLPGEIHLTVRDDGIGLPDGFSIDSGAKLGLAIVKTVVQDDLGGTLTLGGGRGTTVTIRVPNPREE